MKPVLYPKNEKQFRHYGLGEVPFSKCEVTRVRNGEYSLYAEISAEEPQSNLLVEGLLLKADAGVRTKWQTFEIVRIVRNSNDVIKVYANHVSMSTIYSVMNPNVKLSNVDATTALQIWLRNVIGDNEFQVWSDITTLNSTTWNVESIKTARDALGGARGSILDVWGGEYEFDNRLIRLHKQMGRKAPTTIEYGRNLVSAENEVDIAETYTSILPYAMKQGEDANSSEVITLDEKVVHSEYAGKYATVRIMQVDFSSEFKDKEKITQDKLRRLAVQYINRNDIGVPKTEIELKYVDLSTTLDYEQMSIVEEVELCDILPIYYDKLKITNSKAKVSKVVYDVLLDENKTIHVGVIGKTFRETVLGGVQSAVEELQHRTAGIEALPIWQLAANGINTIWYDTPPTDREHKKGDIWFEKNGRYMRMHIWNGEMWVKEFDQENMEEKLSEIDTKVEQANQDLSAERQRLDGVLTDLGVTKDLAQEGKNIAQSALNNALELSTTLLETGDKVRQLELDYDEVENKLNLKLSSADVEQLINGKGFATQTHVNSLVQTAQEYTRELQSVRNLIPTSIGGRNYILNSDVKHATYARTLLTLSEALNIRLSDIREITLSYDTEVVGFRSGYQAFEVRVEYNEGGARYVSVRQLENTSTKRISTTFKVPDDKTIKSITSAKFDNFMQATVSSMGRPKLEIGGVATDWTLALEDGVSTVEFNKVRETAQFYESIIGRTEADATTNISRMLRSSEIFMSEITTGGRRNLYTGTKNFDGSDWATIAEFQKTAPWLDGGTYDGAKVLKSVHKHNGKWQNIEVKAGEKITFSVYAKADTVMTSVIMQWHWDGAPFPATKPVAQLPYTARYVTVTPQWRRYHMTVTATRDGSLQCRIEKTTSDTTNNLYIAKIQVEKGDLTDWTESPHEQVTNRIAQIGRLLELGLFGQEGILDGILIGRDIINIKSKLINLDGEVRMNNAFVTKLVTQHLDTNTLRAMVANINQLNAIQVNANNITTGTMTGINLRGGVLSALNGASSFNLNTGELQFFTDSAAMRRVVSGHPNQFVQFGFDDVYSNDGSQIVRTASTAIGSNRNVNNFTVDQAFVGIRIFNRLQNPYVDRIQYIGDLHEFTHSGNKNDFQNNIWAKSGGSKSDWAQLYPSFSGVKGNSSLGTWTQPWGVLFVEELYIVKRNSAGEIIARNKVY
ncbi:phage tail protein [Aerococcaceae bacterium NML160702]|nr:phage tail protein [Aerococcaceae bacterium NML160702]